ncbi:uncharacterized protein B0P05DRAFT_541039 [Gilbertella persicaria]|uniref:uncharacterized protein n=1 Tax=Gilbertella persicaria TaxID=101096 RepID=UPI00221F83E9|nr:uncharacterized protein B0P05DRAFT_541039 [Gilbertella persicaria]KAI8079546.1 hypothetical protein B0P05DRAFT_541039 [Gilbertella persicaria]
MSFQKAEISSPASYAPIVKQTRYNQILKVGNRIDISGQGGWSSTIPEDGYKFEYKSLEEEIEQAFKNVELVLNSVGACWKNVKSVTSYHTNLEDTRKNIWKSSLSGLSLVLKHLKNRRCMSRLLFLLFLTNKK